MGAMNNAGNNSASNMKAANATYESFVGIVKIATPVIMLIAAVVVMIIA